MTQNRTLAEIFEDEHFVERFNQGCACITLDRESLFMALDQDLARAGLTQSVFTSHPNLFADAPLFLSRRRVHQLSQLIKAIDSVAQSKAWQEAVSQWAPLIATPDTLHKGVFFGYDFHLAPDGLRLIEINTNAGGALFNAYLARAQRACCPPVAQSLVGVVEPHQIRDRFMDMFQREWRAHRGDQQLKTIAIVDTQPEQQGMYPEFVLFKHFFESHNLKAFILDPQSLSFHNDQLMYGDQVIDLVYNRLCDFYLEEPQHKALADAYRTHAAIVTPHPHAYARYADKRNLTLLSDPNWLRKAGFDNAIIDTLSAGVPETLLVTPERADELWNQRKQYFFKPVTGFGSRAVYRGSKVTKKVWEHIIAGGFVAQKMVAPSERMIKKDNEELTLKSDLRAYTYNGEIQFLAARLYRGQTTNMKTEGGGFAPVFTEANHANTD